MRLKKITLILLLLPVLLVASCGREDEEPPRGGLYKHYASQPELTVAQIDGFKLNDTVSVDVLLIQTESDEEWQRLMEEFHIPEGEGTVSRLGNIDDPTQSTSWSNAPLFRVIVSPSRHTIGLYRIDNETQYDALLDYQLEKMKKEK